MKRTVQAEEFQRRTRSLERREARIWLSAVLFIVVVLIGLGAVTARASSNELPFILLGFIALAVLVSHALQKRQQAVIHARQQLVHEIVDRNGVDDLGLLDPLRGLLNRRYPGVQGLDAADRTRLSLTLPMLGLQDFKSPLLGWDRAATDRLLVGVADLLRAVFWS